MKKKLEECFMDAPGSEGVDWFSNGPEGDRGPSELHLKVKLASCIRQSAERTDLLCSKAFL
jgi:hypothetical protein